MKLVICCKLRDQLIHTYENNTKCWKNHNQTSIIQGQYWFRIVQSDWLIKLDMEYVFTSILTLITLFHFVLTK